MVSEKDLYSGESATMRTSRSPTTVITANGEVRTNKEATMYFKKLNLFVKVMFLQETPAVLPLEKLCDEHGKTYHWKSGQNPHLINNCKRIDCKYFLLCTLCGSWNLSEFFLNYFICLFTIFITGVNIGQQ